MKFEQIVRNLLRVHRNLEKKRLVTYEDGVYRITATGTAYLAENRPILRALEEQGFSRTQIRRQLENDFRGIVIEEGAAREVTTTQRKRSQRLRNLKIHEVREANGGRLPCQACTFEFERRYGELGRGFIHIHHQEPVSQMDCEIASNNDPLRGGFRVQF
ncbi:MAG: hypothetical protein HYS63_10540 [Methylocystis sp.]|nr:hypothetical protein [Methylocystis sp.]